MKKNYLTPVSSVETLTLERHILDGSPWYLQGGQGDFNYSVEEDNEFA